MSQANFTIIKWGRFFAVMDGENLVCVCVYKRGAKEVIRRLSSTFNPQSQN